MKVSDLKKYLEAFKDDDLVFTISDGFIWPATITRYWKPVNIWASGVCPGEDENDMCDYIKYGEAELVEKQTGVDVYQYDIVVAETRRVQSKEMKL